MGAEGALVVVQVVVGVVGAGEVVRAVRVVMSSAKGCRKLCVVW